MIIIVKTVKDAAPCMVKFIAYVTIAGYLIVSSSPGIFLTSTSVPINMIIELV